MAPGVDGGRDCILQQEEHGQVVVGFVNHAQTHVYAAMLEGFSVEGLEQD